MRILVAVLAAALALGLTGSSAGAKTSKAPTALTVEQAIKKYGADPCNVCKEKAYFHESKTGKDLYHAMHRDLPLGTILLVERKGMRTAVVIHTVSGGSINISSAAADMLGMRKLGVADVTYRVIAWPKQNISATQKTKPSYLKGLTKEQVNRLLNGEDPSSVIPDVVVASQQGAEESPANPPDGGNEAEPAKPKYVPIVPNDDEKRNLDPQVLASTEFAARVVGMLSGLNEGEILLIRDALVGVCGIESKCNPTFVHKTPSGGTSKYQGIGQMGWPEMKRAHKTLKEFAASLPAGEMRSKLQELIDRFDGVIAKSSPPKKFVGDPRFEPDYGALLLMAFHAKTDDGKNLLTAVLRTFPARDVLGQTIFYKITPDGVDADPLGTITATRVHVAVIQSAQLNPGGLVGDAGKVDLNASWTLTESQNKANAQLLFHWIVKPNDGAGSAGVLMPGAKAPKTKGQAIARIIVNSEARYHVSRAVQDEEYRRAMWKLFISTADTYLAAWEAHTRSPLDAETEQAYKIAENALAEKGWAVRSLLADPGKTLYDKSVKAESFRGHLAKFRITHFKGSKLKFTDKMRDQREHALEMRSLAEEQVNPASEKKKMAAAYEVPVHIYGGVNFALPPPTLADAENRAKYLVNHLKGEKPDTTDTELAVRLVFLGLENTSMFKGLQEARARALRNGKVSKDKPLGKDDLVRANSEIGKAVANLMKTEGPISSFSRKCIDVISGECIVENYLWLAYQRTPVRIDSAGDFTWKDITGTLNAGMSLRDYVVGGMARSIKVPVYFAGKALDADGITWGPLSYYRGLERPAAEGIPAASPPKSKHYNGGYGKGIAADLAGIVRTPQAARWESDRAVWSWLRNNGKKHGLRTHFIKNDPAHVQPDFSKEGVKIREQQEYELKKLVIEKQKTVTLF